ncbi:MAG: MBL fold metallo-hydrolase [bacterium]|nr:MBL fold metallo-hydrolase [bacterium]
MKTNKIRSNIYYIEPAETPFASTSACLFIDSTPSIAIDLNLGDEDTNAFIKEFKPDIALLSHYHLDHSLCAPIMDSHNDIELYVPDGEAAYLTSVDHFISNTCGPYEASKQFKNIIENFLTFPQINNFKVFCNNEIFKTKDCSVRILKVPGHSPSHTAFHIPEENILFTSDTGIGSWGPWYGWIDSDIPQYVESLLKLKAFDDVQLVTCHDGIFSNNINYHWDACIDAFFTREKFIIDKLDQGYSKREIVEEGIYFKKKSRAAEPMRGLLEVQDEIMLEHHLSVMDNGGMERYKAKG